MNQKQYLILEGITEIAATIKDLKEAEVVVPTKFPFKSPMCQCRKQMDHGERQLIIKN